MDQAVRQITTLGPGLEDLYLIIQSCKEYEKNKKKKSHVCCLGSAKADDSNLRGDPREDALLSSCPVHSNSAILFVKARR